MTGQHAPWVVRAIARNAARAPGSPAVEGRRGITSYGQLWEESGQIARLLQAMGVRPGDVVAVGAERGAPFIIASLACWRSGAAYLPLPSTSPPLRLLQIVQESRVRLAVASDGQEDFCRGLGLTMVSMSQPKISVSAGPGLSPVTYASRAAPPAAPAGAYVLYTSGSTGKPKGVLVGHGSLANLIRWHLGAYHVGVADRALHTASLGFDAAVWEIWPYLAAGATLIVCPDEDRFVPQFIAERLADQRCTMVFVATPLAEELLSLAPSLPDLRYLLTGGDVLRLTGPVRSTFQLVNHYGPTEATVVATAHVVGRDEAGGCPPIGAPIDGVAVLLLGSDMRPAAEGATGEIYIGGHGLALGYLHDPELTARRFTSLPGHPGTWFRTGDLAVQRDGTLRFSGRVDLEQLKVRGVRMESAEIESALMACSGVKAAAVTMCGTGADGVLTAVISTSSPAPAVDALRAELRTRLETSVIPNRFIFVDIVPLNENGKVDRQSVARLACSRSN